MDLFLFPWFSGISLIEQHGEEHAEGLISIVEAFEDSAAGTAGGAAMGLMGWSH